MSKKGNKRSGRFIRPEDIAKASGAGIDNSLIALVQEKILTERVEQQVKMKGIEFDEEKLKIERARVVEEMQNDVRKEGLERAKITASAKQKGTAPYKEKGMKSNNKEV